MEGSSIPITVWKDEEVATNNSTIAGGHPQHQSSATSEYGPDQPCRHDAPEGSEAALENDDVIRIKDNFCNDFVTKIDLVTDDDCVEEEQQLSKIDGGVVYDECSTGNSATTRLTDKIVNSENIRFICDLGYGLPNEVRPRKEKIFAIAKQLVTFLSWQTQQQQLLQYPVAPLYIVLGKTMHQPPKSTAFATTVSGEIGKSGDTVVAPLADAITNSDSVDHDNFQSPEHNELKAIHDMLLARMQEVWHKITIADPLPPFPENVITFSYQPLNAFLLTFGGIATGNHRDNDTVYLSPDAANVLDTTKPPPRNIIIGMLIDRRTIQHNRSVLRAQEHHIQAVRWPIESIMTNRHFIPQTIHKNEPLNVDCVLEGMQQWYWNILTHTTERPKPVETLHTDVVNRTNPTIYRETFEVAAMQAIHHHIIRHPQRPLHKMETTK